MRLREPPDRDRDPPLDERLLEPDDRDDERPDDDDRPTDQVLRLGRLERLEEREPPQS